MNTPHPELEALAELADPAIATADRADLLAHVASCAQCTSDVEALRSVRATLRSLPAVPMPPEVAARLEAALEAARQADDLPSGSVTLLPMRSARRRRWAVPTNVAAGIAVLVVIGGGIAIAVAALGSGTSEVKGSAAVPAETSAGSLITASGTSYSAATIASQIASLVTTSVPDAASRYSLSSGAHAAAGAASSAAAAAAPQAAAAATSAGAPANVPANVPSAAASGRLPAASPSASVGFGSNVVRTAPSGPLADPVALQACVTTLAGHPEQPVLVDYATFNGAPATIIVIPDPKEPSKLDVFAIDDSTSCATSFTFLTFIGGAP